MGTDSPSTRSVGVLESRLAINKKQMQCFFFFFFRNKQPGSLTLFILIPHLSLYYATINAEKDGTEGLGKLGQTTVPFPFTQKVLAECEHITK